MKKSSIKYIQIVGVEEREEGRGVISGWLLFVSELKTEAN